MTAARNPYEFRRYVPRPWPVPGEQQSFMDLRTNVDLQTIQTHMDSQTSKSGFANKYGCEQIWIQTHVDANKYECQHIWIQTNMDANRFASHVYIRIWIYKLPNVILVGPRWWNIRIHSYKLTAQSYEALPVPVDATETSHSPDSVSLLLDCNISMSSMSSRWMSSCIASYPSDSQQDETDSSDDELELDIMEMMSQHSSQGSTVMRLQ